MTVYEVPVVGSGTRDDATRAAHAEEIDVDGESYRYYYEGNVVKVASAEEIGVYEDANEDPESDVRKLDATEQVGYGVPEPPEDGSSGDGGDEEDSDTDTEE